MLVQVVKQLGKVPVVVGESPGFLVNRVLFPYLDEAVRLICEGVSVKEVDRAAVGFGMPMGPLELIDQVGLDIAADVARRLESLAAEPSPTPNQLQSMCAAGLLGKKSGAGFYQYRNGRKGSAVTTVAQTTQRGKRTAPLRVTGSEELSGLQQRLIFSLLNESAQCLSEHVVSESWMVDLGLVMGTGYAPFRGGPMQTIEDWGAATCVDALNRLTETCGPRFKPSSLLLETRSSKESVIGSAAGLR
jgi:3-hydroxyacyl-CoA dehydrogenase/enoyl-CoA hydratase/3-hydroxybutyryl-CoA epimerase